ncbi:MAG: hypothetical protein ACT4OM_06240 [Actinomycetota bacterium]
MSDNGDYEPARTSRGRKVLVWAILIFMGLPILFYIFEYVVPRFLPANF